MSSAMEKDMSSEAVESVAIIGMTGRFPGANNIEDFWANLRDGVESVSHFSTEELLALGHDPELIRNPGYVKAKGIVEGADQFDAFFFGISPREAEAMDPQHRVFLECAWEVLEQAGYDGSRYAGRIGVFAGVGPNTYLLHHLLGTGNGPMSDVFQMSIGNDKDFVPTRVSYQLNLTGPSVNVNTGCSSSLVAASLAVQSLLTYQCDMALAGGVALSFPHKTGYLYQAGMIASPDGHCRAFDARAEGAVGSDGVGIVVLKRTEDALADGDTIHALIRGCAINNDGSNKVGYTAPSVDGQARVIAEAIAMAQVPPSTISYVEAHGSGTTLGDPIEVAALRLAFQGDTAAAAPGSCAIGSVKTNIGHTDTAAGMAGLIKTVQALRHAQLPPSLHYAEPNPQIDFGPFYVNHTLKAWLRGAAPRRAGVSSFGIGGTNSHLVLEEAPARDLSSPSRAYQLLTMSAKTPAALQAAMRNLASFLEHRPDLNLADAAFTLTNRRAFPHRYTVVARDTGEAIRRLNEGADGHVAGQAGVRAAFLFPATGPQTIHSPGDLYESEAPFREGMVKCAALFRRLSGVPSADAGLFALEYALAQLWMAWGIQPVALMGEGIGEYVAACVAGVFPLEDAVAIVAGQTRIRPQTPKIPLISSSTGTWIRNADAASPEYWLRQRPPASVLDEGLSTLSMTADVFLEVGPSSGLTARDATVLGSFNTADNCESEVARSLTTLGRLWERGAEVDWSTYYAAETRHRIPLPSYPFERHSYMAKPATVRQTAKAPKPVDQVYVPSWKQVPLPRRAFQDSATWMLFVDDSGLGRQLSDRLRQAGQTVIAVCKGQSFRQDSENAFEINPDAPEDYTALWRALGAARPRRVVHLWNVADGSRESYYGLLPLVHDSMDVFLVANASQRLSDGEEVVPAKAVLLGSTGLLQRQSAQFRCRAIDVAWPADAPTVAAQLLNELATGLDGTSREAQVAYRGSTRWVAGLESVRVSPSPSPIRSGGVYLITEGPRAMQEKIRLLLQAIEADGGQVTVLPADAAIRRASQPGAVHGVIHLAGAPSETDVVVKALAGVPLDFLALWSPLDPVQYEAGSLAVSIAGDLWSNLGVLGAGLPHVIVSALDLEGLMESSSMQDPQSSDSVPAMDRQSRPVIGVEFRPATSPVERWLAEVWQAHLGMEPIGLDDDFFRDLGGQSLGAIALMNRLQERLGAVVPIRAIFIAPSVGQMADYLVENHLESLQRLALVEGSGQTPAAPNPPDAAVLIGDIDQLSDAELDAALAALLEEQAL
jgi:acyl transferase domain-containing protein/acyl carrier protein